MIVVNSAADSRTELTKFRKGGFAVGFVPTMGALHEGHLSLVRRAKKENDVVVMSIFVNPTQFGPNEDFASYPRDLQKDRTLAEAAHVDLLWVPSRKEIYPDGFTTYIEESDLSKPFCGPFRPGHFRGVCTVVFRLLQMVKPQRMYLGQKDAQQLRVLEKMVSDLELGVEVIGSPTVREKDGLAMSSRNAYLSPNEREIAPILYAALKEAEKSFLAGEKKTAMLKTTALIKLHEQKAFEVQYLELRRWRDFQETEMVEEKSLLAVAAYLGKTRLIDNVILTP